MNDNDKEKLQLEWVHRITWRALPRTTVMIVGSSFLALLSIIFDRPQSIADLPNIAIFAGLFAGLVVWIIRELLPVGTVGNSIIWSFFGWLIIFISTPIIKTIVYFLLVGYALWNGSPLLLTLLYFGGLWFFDQLNKPVNTPY